MALDKASYEAKLRAGIERIERESEDARCKNPKDRGWYARELAKLIADATNEFVLDVQLVTGSLQIDPNTLRNANGGQAV